jgi:TPR repeat protein
MSAVCLNFSAACSYPNSFEPRLRWFLIDRNLDSEMSVEELSALSQKISQDLKKNSDTLISEAKGGSSDAQLQLGIMHYYGWGVDRCIAEALYWFEEAATRREEANLLYRAVKLNNESNPKEALPILINLAERGNPFAQRQAGQMLYSGFEVERDEERALLFLEDAAKQGDLEAHYLAQAIRFKSGRGVEQSDQEARDFFLKAASLGNPLAELETGESYFNLTRGQWIDRSAALKWFERAECHGNPAAPFFIEATRSYENWNSFRNQEHAFDCFLEAAHAGSIFAQCMVGDYYETGLGTASNLVTALYWFKKAAIRGSIHAQLRVARFFDRIGFLSKPREAFRLCHQAALSKHPRALCALARLYERGRGVEQSSAMASSLYRMAALKGDQAAQHILSQSNLR